MKKLILIAVVGLWAFAARSEVTITNLVVTQRPGSKLMDITYDVSSATTNAVTISLTVSNGITAVLASNLSGSIGAGISTGTGKSIVWDMGTDWNNNAATLNFSVWAYDEPACPVPKTGQTTSYRTGDDGALQTGVSWPNPRFTVGTNGTAQTVVDNLTGLEWVQAPHTLSGNSGTTNWNGAIDFCNNLVYADHSDWRLPSCKEWMSLLDYERFSPALPDGHPFAGVQSNYYWSGTSSADYTGSAWRVYMGDGYVGSYLKTYTSFYVWPVRGGQ